MHIAYWGVFAVIVAYGCICVLTAHFVFCEELDLANNEVNINLSVAASSNPLSIAGFTLIALLLDELDRQAVIDKQPIIERAMSTAGEFTEGALRDDVLILLRAVQAVPDGDSPPEP